MRRGQQFKVYVVALVEIYGEGITPEQNFCVQPSSVKGERRVGAAFEFLFDIADLRELLLEFGLNSKREKLVLKLFPLFDDRGVANGDVRGQTVASLHISSKCDREILRRLEDAFAHKTVTKCLNQNLNLS
uniref:Uncharacterized protein n=1 Tax=Glossina austeni TaxID=7395 RepID=A0A1A9UQU7_GLOAU